MKIKFLIGLFLLTGFCAVPVFLQDKKEKPNFTGTWNLNLFKSRLNFFGLMSKDSKNIKCSSQLIITHKEPEVNVAEDFECNFPNNSSIKPIVKKYSAIFYTDNRGETTTFDNKAAESKTIWDGNKLVVTYYTTDSKSGKKSRSFILEYKLSKDGKTLTRTSGNASTFGTPDSKQAFNFSNSETLVFNLLEK
jgi:hypothetical protein